MFKPGRWRGEKNKVKAVFKLQFHATQVSDVGEEGLVVSVVPADAGKPPVRSEKAKVQDVRCQWETPIYERVIFTRELRTGKINRRLYRLVVSTGSGKASSVGEVSLDFADYVEATKACSVSLPLMNPNTNAVLHVSIQRMEDNADQRTEALEDTEIKLENRQCVSRSSNAEKDDSISSNFTENAKSNGYGRVSSGSDLTLSTTSDGSISGLNTPLEVGTRHSNMEQQDPASFLSLLSYASVPHTPVSEANSKSYEDIGKPQWEWAFDQKARADDSKERPDKEIKRLRDELSAMASKVDISEMELQTMRRQITKDKKRGQELLEEVEGLRKERDLVAEECQALRALKARFESSQARTTPREDGGDLRAILEEVRQELNYEKEMNLNLRLQLQKTQQSNEELILVVRDLDEMLELKNREMLEFSGRTEQPEKGEVDDTDEEDQKVLEELIRKHKEGKDSAPRERKLVEVLAELEVRRRDKDELEMQMEQLALDYEILKQENHEILYRLEQSELTEQLKAHCESFSASELENRVEVLDRDLEERSKEFSDSVATINDLEIHVTNLEEELESREKAFEANLKEITREKIEQEKRAIRAEETLRKMQRRNAATAQKLQEEFRRLSVQMASMFDENDKAASRAMKEATELRKDKSRIEELLRRADEEIQSVKKSYEEKVAGLSCATEAKHDQIESLNGEVLRLKEENDSLSEKVKQNESLTAELGRLEVKIAGTEAMMARGNEEKNELFKTITMLKEEREEKEGIIRTLQSDLELVRAEFSNLKELVSEIESDKEKLRKQVSQLKSELQKKEDAITRSEKKITGRPGVSNGMRSPLRTHKSDTPAGPGNKEVSSLKEKIKLLEGKIESKEAELRASRSSFSEKEKEMQNKIEGFERILEEQNQRLAIISAQQFQEECENERQRNGARETAKELEILLSESETMKEKNNMMELELMDLQERYSEMSVKFAEVEGERQQLVMTLRSIKNSKSSS